MSTQILRTMALCKTSGVWFIHWGQSQVRDSICTGYNQSYN